MIQTRDEDIIIYTRNQDDALYDALISESDLYADHRICIPYDPANALTNFIASRYPPYADMTDKIHTYPDAIPDDAPYFDRVVIGNSYDDCDKTLINTLFAIDLSGGRLTVLLPPGWQEDKAFTESLKWIVGFHELVEVGDTGRHIFSVKGRGGKRARKISTGVI